MLPSSASVPAAESAPAQTGDGLDAELGSAFDTAFGDRPPEPEPDLDKTQAMGSEDAKRIVDAPALDRVVRRDRGGPGRAAPHRRREAEVGAGGRRPGLALWRPGMGDWSPLSTVAELAAVLSPVPRPPHAASRAPRPPRPAGRHPGLRHARARRPSTAAPDATWKPAGASALAALASEEIQSRAPAAPEAPKPAQKPAGVKSLVEQMNLADQGGVEPTGALPLSIKGVERTDEKPNPAQVVGRHPAGGDPAEARQRPRRRRRHRGGGSHSGRRRLRRDHLPRQEAPGAAIARAQRPGRHQPRAGRGPAGSVAAIAPAVAAAPHRSRPAPASPSRPPAGRRPSSRGRGARPGKGWSEGRRRRRGVRRRLRASAGARPSPGASPSRRRLRPAGAEEGRRAARRDRRRRRRRARRCARRRRSGRSVYVPPKPGGSAALPAQVATAR